jgi:hypothetical protein
MDVVLSGDRLYYTRAEPYSAGNATVLCLSTSDGQPIWTASLIRPNHQLFDTRLLVKEKFSMSKFFFCLFVSCCGYRTKRSFSFG